MFSTLLEIVLKENELEKFLFKTSTFLERGYYLKKGANYSQSYASLVFGTFRRSLDYAVTMEYLEYNISMKVKAISKGKFIPEYWTKNDFERVISQIYIEDYYEHLCFVMLWVYFMTGLRVNEGTALH